MFEDLKMMSLIRFAVTCVGCFVTISSSAVRAVDYYDIDYVQVPILQQPDPMSCWSAAAAMVQGSKACITAAGSPRNGLPANYSTLKKFADDQRLTLVAGASWSVSGIANILRVNGPIWVGLKGKDYRHAVVLVGLKGNDNPESATVVFVDPSPPASRKTALFSTLFGPPTPLVETVMYPVAKIYR